MVADPRSPIAARPSEASRGLREAEDDPAAELRAAAGRCAGRGHRNRRPTVRAAVDAGRPAHPHR